MIFKQGDQLVARLVPFGKRLAGLHEGAAQLSSDFDEPLLEMAENVLELEQQHAQGYKKHPMKDSEVEEWKSEQVSDKEEWEQQFADSRQKNQDFRLHGVRSLPTSAQNREILHSERKSYKYTLSF